MDEGTPQDFTSQPPSAFLANIPASPPTPALPPATPALQPAFSPACESAHRALVPQGDDSSMALDHAAVRQLYPTVPSALPEEVVYMLDPRRYLPPAGSYVFVQANDVKYPELRSGNYCRTCFKPQQGRSFCNQPCSNACGLCQEVHIFFGPCPQAYNTLSSWVRMGCITNIKMIPIGVQIMPSPSQYFVLQANGYIEAGIPYSSSITPQFTSKALLHGHQPGTAVAWKFPGPYYERPARSHPFDEPFRRNTPAGPRRANTRQQAGPGPNNRRQDNCWPYGGAPSNSLQGNGRQYGDAPNNSWQDNHWQYGPPQTPMQPPQTPMQPFQTPVQPFQTQNPPSGCSAQFDIYSGMFKFNTANARPASPAESSTTNSDAPSANHSNRNNGRAQDNGTTSNQTSGGRVRRRRRRKKSNDLDRVTKNGESLRDYINNGGGSKERFGANFK